MRPTIALRPARCRRAARPTSSRTSRARSTAGPARPGFLGRKPCRCPAALLARWVRGRRAVHDGHARGAVHEGACAGNGRDAPTTGHCDRPQADEPRPSGFPRRPRMRAPRLAQPASTPATSSPTTAMCRASGSPPSPRPRHEPSPLRVPTRPPAAASPRGPQASTPARRRPGRAPSTPRSRRRSRERAEAVGAAPARRGWRSRRPAVRLRGARPLRPTGARRDVRRARVLRTAPTQQHTQPTDADGFSAGHSSRHLRPLACVRSRARGSRWPATRAWSIVGGRRASGTSLSRRSRPPSAWAREISAQQGRSAAPGGDVPDPRRVAWTGWTPDYARAGRRSSGRARAIAVALAAQLGSFRRTRLLGRDRSGGRNASRHPEGPDATIVGTLTVKNSARISDGRLRARRGALPRVRFGMLLLSPPRR